MPIPLRLALLLALALGATGCAGVRYFGQAAAGQFEIIAGRESIDALLAAPGTPASLRERLVRVREIRRFAIDALDLPDTGAYTGYTALGRKYAVWNVFAAPELSLTPRQWCYPLAGCFSYHGWFDEGAARAEAARIAASGDDVWVGGVATYSTLGWFADPLLDTMLGWSDAHLAEVIFHELAHAVAYARDDTEFNESFATAVGAEGWRRWSATLPAAQARAGALERERDADFTALLLAIRDALARDYAAAADTAARRRAKASARAAFAAGYAAFRERWDGYAGYDAWAADGIDNARLAAVTSYHGLVPGWEALLAAEGGDLARFHARARALARRPAAARRACLAALAAGSAQPPC